MPVPQMPCKSSVFSPVCYNATLFSASCTPGSDARIKISGILIEISIQEDGNFHSRLWPMWSHQSHVKTIMPVTVPLRALQTQWKYKSNKSVNILFIFHSIKQK